MTEVLVLFMRISVLISQEPMSDGLLVLPWLFSAVDGDLVGSIHRQFCSVTNQLYLVHVLGVDSLGNIGHGWEMVTTSTAKETEGNFRLCTPILKWIVMFRMGVCAPLPLWQCEQVFIPSLIIVHFHVICYQVRSVDIALGVRLGYFMYEIYGSLLQLYNHLFMRRTKLT